MADFDVDAALRWFRIAPRGSLVRRSDPDLPFLRHTSARPPLLLDTCVYIDRLRGRLPKPVAILIEASQVHHSAVAIGELMFSCGALDPADPRTPRTMEAIRRLVGAMRPHRTFAPDSDLLARAAMLAGLLCRVQNFTGEARKRALPDATLFLQAQKLGLTVLTRNIGDFDLLLQVIPSGRVLLYRDAG